MLGCKTASRQEFVDEAKKALANSKYRSWPYMTKPARERVLYILSLCLLYSVLKTLSCAKLWYTHCRNLNRLPSTWISTCASWAHLC